MSGRATPIEHLPEAQPVPMSEGDLVQDIMDEYNTQQPPRPQGIQPGGAADAFHHVPQPQYAPQNKPIMREDWQSYLMREGKLPLLVAILYFVLSLDFVDEQLLKYIPRLFSDSCELTMSGVLFKAGLLAGLLLLIKHFV